MASSHALALLMVTLYQFRLLLDCFGCILQSLHEEVVFASLQEEFEDHREHVLSALVLHRAALLGHVIGPCDETVDDG